MVAITRNYGTIIEDPHARVEAAKNDLLERMYHARELPTMEDARSGWTCWICTTPARGMR